MVEYRAEHEKAAAQYTLTDEMLYYTGRPQNSIIISHKDNLYHSILVFEQNQLVSFFVLDEGDEKLKYWDNPSAILFRRFSTDSRYKGKGYGKKVLSLLPSYVKANYPYVAQIVLAVEQSNHLARRLYLKYGFVDTGLRKQGETEEQLVFVLNLLL